MHLHCFSLLLYKAFPPTINLPCGLLGPFSSLYLGGLEMSNCIELYIRVKHRISIFRICPWLKIHVWRLFCGFVMQSHKYPSFRIHTLQWYVWSVTTWILCMFIQKGSQLSKPLAFTVNSLPHPDVNTLCFMKSMNWIELNWIELNFTARIDYIISKNVPTLCRHI